MHGRHTLSNRVNSDTGSSVSNVSPPSSPDSGPESRVSPGRAQEDRAQFEQWCELAEEWVLSTLASIALSRSAELAAHGDWNVRVLRAASHGRNGSGPRYRVVSLALGASRVDIYSTREPGQTPSIHFAVTRAPTTTRFPVVMTVPGCVVVRRPNGEIALIAALAEHSSGLRPAMAFDAVVVRAFELLVGAHRSARRAAA